MRFFYDASCLIFALLDDSCRFAFLDHLDTNDTQNQSPKGGSDNIQYNGHSLLHLIILKKKPALVYGFV